MADLPALLDAMVSAAIEAGRAECEIYRSEFKVYQKDDDSPVTAADQAAEAIILERLRAVAPMIPIVAEEEVAAGRIPSVAHEFFLVDPLDGTKEFIAKRGDFTVNIALIRGGAPLLGVVFAPANSKLYVGDVSTGKAYRADQAPDPAQRGKLEPMRVRALPARGLTAVASRSHSNPETDEFLARHNVVDRVSVGSSLKFCLVAAGEADVYPRLGTTMEWDTAAGHAVLLAAGGEVKTPEGAPLRYGKPNFRNSHFIASGAAVPLSRTA